MQSGLSKSLGTSKGKHSARVGVFWGRKGGKTAQKFTWEEVKKHRSGTGSPGHGPQICSATTLSPLPTREKTELYLDPSGHQPAPEPGEPMLQGSCPPPRQP